MYRILLFKTSAARLDEIRVGYIIFNPQGTNWVSVTQANFESGAICRGPMAAPPTKGGGKCLGYHMSKSQLAALFDVQCLCYSETKIEVGYFSPSSY